MDTQELAVIGELLQAERTRRPRATGSGGTVKDAPPAANPASGLAVPTRPRSGFPGLSGAGLRFRALINQGTTGNKGVQEMVHDITTIGVLVIAVAAVVAVVVLVQQLRWRRSAALAWARAEATSDAAPETSGSAPELSVTEFTAAIRQAVDGAIRELTRNGIPEGFAVTPHTTQAAVLAWRRCLGALLADSVGLTGGAWRTGLERFAEGLGGTRVDAYMLISKATAEMTANRPPEQVSLETAHRALEKLATLRPDDQRGTLSFGDFNDANFAGARFRGVTFRECSFRGAKLNGSRFEECSLNRADMDGADLRGAHFRMVSINETKFRRADLSNAVFDRVLRGNRPDFREATLCGARFGESRLTQPNFKEADLHNARFYGCALVRPDFVEARLRGGKFVHTRIERGEFNRVQGQGVILEDCDTRGTHHSLPREFILRESSHKEASAAT